LSNPELHTQAGNTLKQFSVQKLLNYPIFKHVLFRDFLLYYTFAAIFAKCILFVGFELHQTHTFPRLFTALDLVVISKRLPIYVGFIALLLSFSFLLKNRGRLWYLISYNFLFSLIFLVDLIYLRGFNALPSMHVLGQTSNLHNLWECIFSMTQWVDAFFLIDIIALVVFAIVRRKTLYCSMERSILGFAAIFAVSLLIVSYIPVSIKFLDKHPLSSRNWQYNSILASHDLSPVGYHIYNIYTFWKDSQKVVLTPEEKEDVKKWLEDKKENLPDNKYKGMYKGKNLILIQFESLENFVINQKIEDQEITPNLNKLLKSGIYFPNMHEQAREGTSSDAELAANTSMYPLLRGSTFFRYPHTTYRSLPKVLKEQGYSTVAYHADVASFWNWVEALTNIGYDTCVDSTKFKMDDEVGMGLSDGSFLRQIEPMIVRQKQPFLSFIITLTSHGPYELPGKYRELGLDKKYETYNNYFFRSYLESIHYVDKQLGKFLEELDKDGIMDNTVVAIYGDHEGLTRYYQDGKVKDLMEKYGWNNNNKRIPLIIYSKGMQPEVIETRGGQIDIMPTLSYLMGVDEKQYGGYILGRNLLNTKKDFAVLSNYKYLADTVTDENLKYAAKDMRISDLIIRSNYFKDILKDNGTPKK